MAFSSTSSIHKSFDYDVFLSFRGEDTRTNFVDHLYHALQQKNIHTYKDDCRIKKGKKISEELIKAIEDSKFYIIVFSKNYASSSWCLDELVKIMDCHKTTEHSAYPVFYDVEPSEVRKQSGAVKEAFAKHENKEDAEKWRDALKEAADLAGWELKNTADRHEAKFIHKIVQEISLELRSINFSIDGKLVGMETRIKDVISALGTSFDDVHMIGIRGMGGGGKTTLARVVFDKISSQFEGKSFIENVREVSKASLFGLKSLQNQILSDVLNDQGITVSSVFDGKSMMKRRMRGKKVLIVLDDVDHIEQLDALAGELNWFKPGSTIIITTRDEQVLVAHGVKLICNVKLFLDEEAICLFSRYAFGRENPNKGYEELSSQVVHYAAGLPLTIRVLGSFLCGKSKLEWIDALERLKTIPLTETLKKLELSYDGLEDDYKEIFLDVACILKGWSKSLAVKALESCGFHARNALRVLEQKSLITIDDNSDDDECLGMHDHIEEMGRNIVRRSHPNKPNRHSRLWINKEIEDVLANDLGTEATRCVQFYTRELSPEVIMKGLRKMKELRYLDVSVGSIDASKTDFFPLDWRLYKFPNALRYLHWNHYPFRSLPNKFHADNLVALKMADSRIEELWEGGERKVLYKLRFLDLSYSMLRTYDLGLTPNLETLTLKGCGDLIEVHMLVERLKLISVDLSCTILKTLNLGSAPNLERLDLENCSDLVELHMSGRCLNLRSLKLSNSKLRTLDIRLTPILEYLDLKNCYELEEINTDDECRKLASLNISRSKVRNLDLGMTPNLRKLDLKRCYNLVQLHLHDECLKKLVYLDLSGCLRFKSFLFQIEDGASCSEDDVSCTDENASCSEGNASSSVDNASCSEGDVSCTDENASCSDDNASCSEDDASCSEDSASCSANESLEVGPSASLHLIAESLDRCAFHPDNNLPKFQFTCFYKEDQPLWTRNLEKLISVGLCACTNLEMFSRSICGLECLRKLELEGNFQEVPTDIDQLECLEKLTLTSTKIKDLPDSICMLKCLKSLKVKSCWILEKLPENLGRLEFLEKLTLSSTKIKDLPDSIYMLKHLECLKLNDCSFIEKLPEDLGRLECLKKLSLTSTKFKNLPDSICMLKNLESLDLNDCSFLEKLPEDLGQLEGLKRLSLTSTQIKDLPDSVCMLKHLESLELYDCSLLEKLPKDLGQLDCLKNLSVTCAKIKDLPDSICMLKHLELLDLNDCSFLEKLPENLGRLECLEYLTLSSARIKDLPDSICMLKQLKSLKLNDCLFLEKLPLDLGQLDSLKMLSLTSAKIKDLPDSICSLKNLEVLDLNDCSILEKLPENLGRLERLEKLTFSSTKIEDVPNGISMLGHQGSFELDHSLLEKLTEYLGEIEEVKKQILIHSKVL